MRPVCQLVFLFFVFLLFFFTLYITLPHNLIKEKLLNLIERSFKRECSPYIACNERQVFFTSGNTKRYNFGRVKKCVKPEYIFWIIFILELALSYTDKLLVFRWVLIVLLLQLIYFHFMTSLSDVKKAEIIEAF